MKRNIVLPKMNTLRQRMILAMGICVGMCLLLLLAFSYTTIKMMEEDRIQAAMQSDLRQISEQFDTYYYSLLQISQQMMPDGNVGNIAEEYLQSEDAYDRILYSKQLSSGVSIMMFASTDVTMAAYYRDEEDAGGMDAWFSTFPGRDTFRIDQQPMLIQTGDLTFHSLHASQNRFVDKNVVSMSRPLEFGTGDRFIIYVELYCNVLESLDQSSQTQNLDYSILQLDEGGTVRYSSTPSFSVGETVSLTGEKGVAAARGTDGVEYACLGESGRFGSRTAVLVPMEQYRGEMRFWIGGLLLAVILALGAVTVSIVLLSRLIYRPMQMLEREIEQVGRGDLSTKEHHAVNIREFDVLFGRIQVMKQEIAGLMDDIREQEKQKQQLELSNLYYQINPHFLMNALNSVHWMAVTRGEKEIDSFIYYLNYILGYSLGRTNQKATFRTELKSLEAYLELQKKRYDFKTEFDVEEGDYLEYPCARLILQPIAENAVCHNMEEFGTLWFSIHPQEPGHVILQIRDDGKGFVVEQPTPMAGAEGLPEDRTALAEEPIPRESRKNRGIGLQYVRRVLEDFYGGAAELTIESEPGRGTTVTLRLPMRRE